MGVREYEQRRRPRDNCSAGSPGKHAIHAAVGKALHARGKETSSFVASKSALSNARRASCNSSSQVASRRWQVAERCARLLAQGA